MATRDARREDTLLSMHAIDRASTRLSQVWRRRRAGHDEGIASWLRREAMNAVVDPRGMVADDGSVHIQRHGVVFVFDMAGPTLTTVYPASRSSRRRGAA